MTSAEKLFRLDGKIALVTGAYSDIGAAVTKGLLEMGAKVAVAGHNTSKVVALAAAMKSAGHEVLGETFDAFSIPQTNDLVARVAAHYGRLNILINAVAQNREQKAEEVTEDQFDIVVGSILKGSMFQAQAAARQMIKQGEGGRQIHFGSVRSLLGIRSRGFAAYCAAKGGLSILCKQLAAEWAPHKIGVNVVAPTFVRTQQVAKWLADEAFYNSIVNRIPLGRIGEPEDVVGAVLYLASPASHFVTGQTLFLDGGVTATQ